MTRSFWKGFYIDPKLFSQIKQAQEQKSKYPIKVWSRQSTIYPEAIDLQFLVHNGKNFTKLIVTDEMIGHKFGEFAFTRRPHIYKKKK
nr:ribosomal protein S19 [Microheliella maris]